MPLGKFFNFMYVSTNTTKKRAPKRPIVHCSLLVAH